MEQIEIVKEEVGGYTGRKILYFPDSGKVLLKRLKSTVDSRIIEAEQAYKTRLFEDKEKLLAEGGELTLFE
jgi:chemotaxis protein CheD